MLTKSGVCYDLPNSPYKVIVQNHTFMFSTMRAKRRFESELPAEREKALESFRRISFNRNNIQGDVKLIAALKLYKRCESRGFSVKLPSGHYASDIRTFEIIMAVTCDDSRL